MGSARSAATKVLAMPKKGFSANERAAILKVDFCIVEEADRVQHDRVAKVAFCAILSLATASDGPCGTRWLYLLVMQRPRDGLGDLVFLERLVRVVR
jgi:hypothetical protein